MSFLRRFRNTDHLFRRRRPPHQADEPILRANGLTVRYDSGLALDAVSFELCAGEQVAVVGPNGAGKSTLFKVIAGVLDATEGRVDVFGNEPGGHICIAYVPQRSQVDWNFPVNVADVVMMGRVGKMGLFRHRSTHDREIVREALDVVKLVDLAERQIGELSGGQQQRMFIARALAQEAELVLMDEPLTGLDVNSQDAIFQILNDVRQQNVTVMVAMHDLRLAAERFDRVMLLNHDLIGFGTPEQVFDSDNLMQAYGGHLHVMNTPDGVFVVEDTCCDEGESHNG